MSILHLTKNTLRYLIWLSGVMSCLPAGGQTPFVSKGQVFMVLPGPEGLSEMKIIPGNDAVSPVSLSSNPGQETNAMGYRRTDRLLYGIGANNHHLYRIDANGIVEDLGGLSLGSGLTYLAGDVSTDGKYLYCIGSYNGTDKMLSRVDLNDPNFGVYSVNLTTNLHLSDIAFDPYTGRAYGFDKTSRSVVSINLGSNVTQLLQPIDGVNDIAGLYFNAFGDLMAIGSTANGIASALFSVDKNTGKETTVATGPPLTVMDVASCPYGIEIRKTANPATALPCSEVSYTYRIANGSGQIITGVDMEHILPPGFTFSGLLQNPYGWTLESPAPPGVVRFKNITLSTGVHEVVVTSEAGDLAAGLYKSQALLSKLPESLGISRPSDNPLTPAMGDSTTVKINRIEAEVLAFTRLLCHGQTIVLDASQYGNNLHWDNGSTEQKLTVSRGGTYKLEVNSGCQEFTITYEVTPASCPFTIQLEHTTVPDTVFPCNEVIYRFYIDNDSGEKRQGFSFADTLPPGLKFLDLLKNPFGGTLQSNFPSSTVLIENMTMQKGLDSLDLLVEVTDLPPGNYYNRAFIKGLPHELGPTRPSDDPRTLQLDSTALHVLGTSSDTTYVEGIICKGTQVVLDASKYGKNYLWEDGSTKATLNISSQGIYQVKLFDGCKPSFVFFEMREGPLMEISTAIDTVRIHLGESWQLSPLIVNESDSTFLKWTDRLGNSLSCLNCNSPLASPLESTVYGLKTSNGICSDSVSIYFLVDNTRRIYAPNVFSPNGDGINDWFYLQSPDFGIIHSMTVADRWGNVLFKSDKNSLNDEQSGWDGKFKSERLPPSQYIWRAEIEFLDKKREVFYGSVGILR